MATALRTGFHGIVTLVFILFFLWGGLALWYRLPFGGVVLAAVLVSWAFLAVFVTGSEWTARRFKARILAVVFFTMMMVWWNTLHPSPGRNWRPELARTVEGKIEGSRAYLYNIRDFSWQTPDQGGIRWLDADYDLDTITDVNVYLSYWMGSWIAHTLVGFRFADGRELVLSSEIRRIKGSRFSVVGGFFKQFELAMIAALPEDIIRLRTDVRREDVFRYRLGLHPEKARMLFEIYIDTANSLARDPEFYNTVTTNCTTVVFRMAQLIDPGLSLDWRVLFSGKLPSWLYDHGVIDTSMSLHEVAEKAYITGGRPVPSGLLP